MRYLTAGESHGRALVGIVEGLPAGLSVSADAINRQLARRWLGFGRGGRAKFETDLVELTSGIRFGQTMASPVALRLDNAAFERDKSGWPDVMNAGGTGEGVEPVTLPRPGHADLVAVQKYGFAAFDGRPDIRPSIERSSARETAMRVACCTLGRELLRAFGITVGSHVVRIGEVGYDDRDSAHAWAAHTAPLVAASGEALGLAADQSDVRMLSDEVAERARDHIRQAKADGDSLGGVYEVVVTGLPPGLGSYVQWDRKLDGRLAQAILSIQAQKAVEIGDGFAGARTPGSRLHDPIVLDEAVPGGYGRASNRAGGLEGGVTTGQPLVVRGFMKPIPTLIRPLGTVDLATGEAVPTRYERSDVTSVPAAAVVAEAVVAWTLAEALVETLGGDTVAQMTERFAALLR